MVLSAQLTLALILLASIALNVGLILWMVYRGAGPKRQLEVWDGRGWDVVNVKKGQTRHVYKRADGTKAVFLLEERYAQPIGKRGLRWLANGLNSGDMFTWKQDRKAWVRLAPPIDGSRADPATWVEVPDGQEPEEQEGAFLAVEWMARPMSPSADYLAVALDDMREEKWFKGQAAADAMGKVKPNWLLIAAAAVAVWFFFLRGG